MKTVMALLALAGLATQACADGHEISNRVAQSSAPLWLRVKPLSPEDREAYAAVVKSVCCPGASAIVRNARDELLAAAGELTGGKVTVTESVDVDGTVVLGTCEQLNAFLPAPLAAKVASLKDDGYVLQNAILKGKKITVITSRSEAGVLYGVFHLMRLMQTGQPIATLSVAEEPAVRMRLLNHWDNLNGSVERGYGGRSLWKWDELPDHVNARCREYARLCASVGINGVVLNNVNADPRILRADYLVKVAALADLFRTWGIRTYVSANFAAPMRPSETPDRMKRWGGVGNLETSDPLDPAVRAWWKKKAAEIYAAIPDFGGFLVKADSEGMAGPKAYGRTHVDGANMLADALGPHGGTLIWRAFVYGKSDDRATDAYNEFKKYDGQFRDNVFIQVKNGPLDFQPYEPFTPLFGAMPKTHLAMELQVAKEYLGHATTLAYLGPMWSKIFGSDTYVRGSGSTVARVIDGSLHGQQASCISGVANIGDGAEWCGSVFNQANWYAYGRLAWNPRISPEAIAEEWIRMTFPCDAETRQAIKRMMMGSYQAYVDYTMPLGLNFLPAQADHYKPAPASRVMYHKADAVGLGFDRTRHGSNFVGQYAPERQALLNDPKKISLDELLWFHHVPWQAKLSSGRTLWEELNVRYDRGVAYVDEMAETWEKLQGKVDPDIYASVMKRLQAEQKFSRQWRDECLRYFSGFVHPESI